MTGFWLNDNSCLSGLKKNYYGDEFKFFLVLQWKKHPADKKMIKVININNNSPAENFMFKVNNKDSRRKLMNVVLASVFLTWIDIWTLGCHNLIQNW